MGLERVGEATCCAVAARSQVPIHGSPALHTPAMLTAPSASPHPQPFRLLRMALPPVERSRSLLSFPHRFAIAEARLDPLSMKLRRLRGMTKR
jgi:hypothetical protein